MSIGIFGKVVGTQNNNWNNPSSWSSSVSDTSAALSLTTRRANKCRRTTYTFNPKKKNCKYKYECKNECKTITKKQCSQKLNCKTYKKKKCEVIQQTVCNSVTSQQDRRLRTRVKRANEEKIRRRHKRTIGAIFEAKKQFWRHLFGIKKPSRPNYPASNKPLYPTSPISNPNPINNGGIPTYPSPISSDSTNLVQDPQQCEVKNKNVCTWVPYKEVCTRPVCDKPVQDCKKKCQNK